SAGNSGRSPASSNIGIVALLQTDTCHVARALASGRTGRGDMGRQVSERQPRGLPPPLWGRVGVGGRAVGRSRCHLARPPPPTPPNKGGEEFAATSNLNLAPVRSGDRRHTASHPSGFPPWWHDS